MKTVIVESLDRVTLNGVNFGNICEASRNLQQDAEGQATAAEILRQAKLLVQGQVDRAVEVKAKTLAAKAKDEYDHLNQELLSTRDSLTAVKAEAAKVQNEFTKLKLSLQTV